MSRLLRGFAVLVARLPWHGLATAGAAVGWLAGSVLGIRRRAVLEAMTTAQLAEPKREARAMYANLGTGAAELLWLAGSKPSLRAAAVREQVALDADLAFAVTAACARGPVVLAASHTGNWELSAYGMAAFLKGLGRGLGIVVKAQSVGVVHAFCTDLRTACGVTLIAPKGALAEAKRRLTAGDVVAMPIDQVPDSARHAIAVSFLGGRAHADRAPSALARATSATLIVLASSRVGRVQRMHLLAELAPDSPRNVGSRAWIDFATARASASLEAFVRDHPSSWLWLHRRWRAPFERGIASKQRGIACHD